MEEDTNAHFMLQFSQALFEVYKCCGRKTGAPTTGFESVWRYKIKNEAIKRLLGQALQYGEP
jgi:hypothetical protein